MSETVIAHPIITRLALPAHSRAGADRSNRIAGWRSPLPLPGNEAFVLQRLQRSDSGPEHAAKRLSVALTIGSDRLIATMPRRLVLDLLRSLDADLRLDPMPPPDLAALLLEAALLPLAEIVERSGGRDVALQAVAASLPPLASDQQPDVDADGDTAMQASFLLSGPGLRQTLTIAAPAAAIDRLLRPWPIEPRPMALLPMLLSLQAGATELTVRQIASLRVGDAVLLQDPAGMLSADGRPSALRLVVAETLAAAIHRTPEGWRLHTAPQRTSRTDPILSDLTKTADLDDVPMRLIFEAARLELPLGELRRLGAGSILEIGSIPGIVRLLVNEKRLGEGELITVDGRAAVRVLTFADGSDPTPVT